MLVHIISKINFMMFFLRLPSYTKTRYEQSKEKPREKILFWYFDWNAALIIFWQDRCRRSLIRQLVIITRGDYHFIIGIMSTLSFTHCLIESIKIIFIVMDKSLIENALVIFNRIDLLWTIRTDRYGSK